MKLRVKLTANVKCCQIVWGVQIEIKAVCPFSDVPKDNRLEKIS